MLAKFDELVAPKGYPWKVEDILPKVLVAGEKAGTLTEEGAKASRTQQESFRQAFRYALRKVMQEPVWQLRIVSESAPVMYQQEPVYLQWLFLKKHLRKYMEEIDMVTTPAGDAVAMVHCNNCTSDLNAWVNIFKEFAKHSV